MVLVTSARVVWTTGESPATVTVSCTDDSLSVTFNTARCPALNVRFSRRSLANPASEVCRMYWPAGGSDVKT